MARTHPFPAYENVHLKSVLGVGANQMRLARHPFVICPAVHAWQDDPSIRRPVPGPVSGLYWGRLEGGHNRLVVELRFR